MHGGRREHDGADDNGDGSAEDLGPAFGACAFQLMEEEPAPEQADEGVGVPERKGDGKADVANGEDSQRVGDSPEGPGKDGPDDEVGTAAEVAEDVVGSFKGDGERPACDKDAEYHAERDGIGREAGGNELGGSLRPAQPCACSKRADDAQAMEGAKRALVPAGSCGFWHAMRYQAT